ncbi:hypothetical protein [Nitratireductor luteus]|uniref:hypothetical protein n=1 Tax=Nitratireductor luteus TaxID=2976980 RepID=UPI00223F5773
MQRLMRDAQHVGFKILLAETLDRINRDQARCRHALQAVEVRGRHPSAHRRKLRHMACGAFHPATSVTTQKSKHFFLQLNSQRTEIFTMSRIDIAIWIELSDIELRRGLPADESAWSRAEIAELQAQLDAMEEAEGA